METGNKQLLYKRVWEHLRMPVSRSRVGWGVRAMIVLALMLTGFSLWVLLTQYARDHEQFLGVVVGTMIFIAARFIIARRKDYRPDRLGELRYTSGKIGFKDLLIGYRGNRQWANWRRFVFANLMIAGAYLGTAPATMMVKDVGEISGRIQEQQIAHEKWCGMQGTPVPQECVDWAEQVGSWYKTHAETVNYWFLHSILAIGGAVGSCLLILMVLRIRRFIAKKREADQKVHWLIGEVHKGNEVIKALRTARDATAPVIAEAIVRLRGSKGKPAREVITTVVETRSSLEAQLAVLMPDQIRRDAMLEQARRKVEETAEQFATPAGVAV